MDVKRKENLISKLIGEGYLKSERVIKAFRDVPREEFVPEKYRNLAYDDCPLEIGHDQTISAPHMVAIMTELLKPRKTDKVLEIGAGSGYQVAVLSRLVKYVYTIELETELVLFARNNLERTGCTNVKVIVGDGSEGYAPAAPYDKIIVTCATPGLYKAWRDQLKENGIIIAPVGDVYRQDLVLLEKTKDGFRKESHGGCRFVPLRQK